jgi:CBS domain-containing protein
MTVAKILKTKGPDVFTVQAGDTLTRAAELLRTHRIGALVAVDPGGAPIGVLSERDIVRAIALDGCDVLDQPVRDYMTSEVHTCRPRDSIDSVMAMMTDRRIRHIPVMVDGRLGGIVSIGDAVKQRIADAEAEAAALKDYIATG